MIVREIVREQRRKESVFLVARLDVCVCVCVVDGSGLLRAHRRGDLVVTVRRRLIDGEMAFSSGEVRVSTGHHRLHHYSSDTCHHTHSPNQSGRLYYCRERERERERDYWIGSVRFDLISNVIRFKINLVRDISVTIHILLGYERDILRELMLLVVKRTPEEMAYIKRLISGFYESILDHSNNDQFGMGNLSFLVSSSCSY